MRESYHDELNATSGRILTMAELVRVAVKDATAALIGADLTTAEPVSYTHLTLPTICSV